MRYFFSPLVSAFTIALTACSGEASHTTTATAHYLANEGVMVVRGDTKVVFDPLFENSYGQYQLPPVEMRAALFAGLPPYDGVDAVFISHYHGDHFSPSEMLQFLKAQTAFKLVAPAQAVEALRKIASADDAKLFERVVPVALAYGDAPIVIEFGGLLIEAVRIPHSGWPASRTDVQNIAFRVTLDNQVTVLHMGDADTKDVHFDRDPEHWAKRQTHMAFPPYWYFLDPVGRDILDHRLTPLHSVGVHVPEAMPDDPAQRPSEIQGFDLFTEPGETRPIPTSDQE